MLLIMVAIIELSKVNTFIIKQLMLILKNLFKQGNFKANYSEIVKLFFKTYLTPPTAN